MNLYCIADFKIEFEKLIKKRSYRSLQEQLISYFFGKEVNDVISGTRLNGSSDTPLIKKRLDGSGGFRVYYLLLIIKDSLYLIYVHPKTGSYGSPNLKDNVTMKLYKKLLTSITENDLFELSLVDDKIVFTKTTDNQ
jgi:hypothetical protein